MFSNFNFFLTSFSPKTSINHLGRCAKKLDIVFPRRWLGMPVWGEKGRSGYFSHLYSMFPSRRNMVARGMSEKDHLWEDPKQESMVTIKCDRGGAGKLEAR